MLFESITQPNGMEHKIQICQWRNNHCSGETNTIYKCSKSNLFREINIAERGREWKFQENESAIDQESLCLDPRTRDSGVSRVLHVVCSDSLWLHPTQHWTLKLCLYTFLLNYALRTQNLGSSCLMRSSNFQSLYALPGMFFQWWLSGSCLGGGLNHNLDQSSGYLMWVLKRPIWCRCGREILREGNQGQTLDISFIFLPYGCPQGALEVKF